MTDIAVLFDQAADVAKACKDMSEDDRIALYAYYKQATVGSATKIAKPAFGGTKWVTWHALGMMTQEDAKYNYCALVDQLSPGWRPDVEEIAEHDVPVKRGPDIDRHFADAACEAGCHSDLNEQAPLRFYALYNQATAGPVTGARPQKREVVKRAKWDAWSALGTMSCEEAKQKYCALVEHLAPGRYSSVPACGATEPHVPVVDAAPVAADVDALFAEASDEAKKHPDFKKEAQLQLYAHFKQATNGPATGSRPGMFDPVKRAKWDAHNALGLMSQDAAKKTYITFVEELVPEWQPTKKPAVAQPCAAAPVADVNVSASQPDIDALFAEVACDAKEHPELSKQVPLRLFALHNQATAGPATGSRPDDAGRRAKWDAWNALGSMSWEVAKQQYCELIDLLLPGWHVETAPWGEHDDQPMETVKSEIPGETASQHSSETKLSAPTPDINTLFTEATTEATKHPDLGKQDQLQLYAHYKQATAGPATGSRPGMFDPVKRTKWDAWNALGTMSQEDAKREYCSVVDKCVPGWRAFQPETRAPQPDTGATPSVAPPPPTETRQAGTGVSPAAGSQTGHALTPSVASVAPVFDVEKIAISIPTVTARDGVQWYCINVGQEGHDSTVWRRYNQFHDLNVKFGDSHRLFPNALFPPKLRSSPSGQALEERRLALEAWLRHAINHPKAKGPWAQPVRQFLTAASQPPQPSQSPPSTSYAA